MPKRIRHQDSKAQKSMEKPSKKAKKRDAEGWRAVEGTEFLETFNDGDFMGLEELDAPKIFSSIGGTVTLPEAASPSATAAGKDSCDAVKSVKKAKPTDAAVPSDLKKACYSERLLQGSPKRAHITSGDSGIASEAADEVKDRARRYQERILAQKALRNEKLAAAKAKVEESKLTSEVFKMPEGLSRSQQKKLLMDLKRARQKATRKHQKTKIAERRGAYKKRKAARDAAEGSDSGEESPVEAVDAGANAPNMTAWEIFGLHPAIISGLAAKGFVEPTPIQEACLQPAIHGRRDIIGAAQTGSGKTLAFGLPVLQRLIASGCGAPGLPDRSSLPMSNLRCLVLLPTRELAMQVEQHLQVIARFCGIRTASIVGGLSALKQERILSKRPAIVAATPGRLWDLMSGGGGTASGGGSSGGVASKHLTDVSCLDFLVIDEADRMVQDNHFEELGNIIAYIMANRDGSGAAEALDARKEGEDNGSNGNVSSDAEDSIPDSSPETTTSEAGNIGDVSDSEADSGSNDAATPTHTAKSPLQLFVYSATLTLPHLLRKRLRRGGGGAGGGSSSLDSLMDQIPFGPRPKVVDLTSNANRLASKLQEAVLKCDERHRDELLYYLLVRHPGRTLVFVNAVSATRRLTALLKHLGMPAIALHANQQQRQRLKALDRFKTQSDGVLVATDVAARGLDVKDIRCVVHYQLPASADLYVHRSGRTARAASDGVTVALVTPSESRRWDALQTALDRSSVPEFPVDENLLPACKQRVSLAVRLDSLARSSSKAQADKSWMTAAAADLGVELDDEEVASDGGIARPRKHRELLRRMKKAGRKTGDLREENAVRQELAALLAEPLRGGFSQKYFTGGASGAAAMLPTPTAAGSSREPFSGGNGMASVVQVVSALRDSRSAATADIEAKRTAASKRAKRDKAQRAMLQHSNAGPAEATAPSETVSAMEPTGGRSFQGVSVAADNVASASHPKDPQATSTASAASRKAVKMKQKGSQAVSNGSKAEARSSVNKRKRAPGSRLPAALGRDVAGEDVVAALQNRPGQ